MTSATSITNSKFDSQVGNWAHQREGTQRSKYTLASGASPDNFADIDDSLSMGEWMGVASRKILIALSTVMLLSGAGIVSAGAKISGPTIGCPFALLQLMHLRPGENVVVWGCNGGGFTATGKK